MSVKYEFMAAGVNQMQLADMVEHRLETEGAPWRCTRVDVSTTLSKAEGGVRMTEKEQRIYHHLLDIREEMKNGKTRPQNH